MDAVEELCGFHGLVQGGAIVGLADYAFAAASNAHGVGAVALTMNFTFVARSAGPPFDRRGDRREARPPHRPVPAGRDDRGPEPGGIRTGRR